MEKILVMFSQFSLLLFSAWSFYFARVESAFSDNKKPYGGQSRVLLLILITNLYSKFRRVFCPDSWDIRYTYTCSLMMESFQPQPWAIFARILPPSLPGKLWVCHLDKWHRVTMTSEWMFKFWSGFPGDDWTGHSVANCEVSSSSRGCEDPPWVWFSIICYNNNITLSRGNQSQPAWLSCLLSELNSARRERETVSLSNRVMQSPQRGGNSNGNQSLTLYFYNWNWTKNLGTKTITLLYSSPAIIESEIQL